MQGLLNYILENDTEAFNIGFIAERKAGRCTMFKRGEPVFLTGSDQTFSSRARQSSS